VRNTDVAEESSGDTTFSDPPRSGYDWVSDLILQQSSKYRWPSSLEYFVASVPMVVPEVESGFVSMEKCSTSDRVCYGREEGESDFFFMYSAFFTDVHVRLPLDEFTMGVLRILHVAPTQLHPNSWGYLQCFRLLCEMFGLVPSPQSFLHYYSARPSNPVRWVSLVSQSGGALFAPYTVSYKRFKTGFFRVAIEPAGRQYFYYGDVPKFPLHWTPNPVHYLYWPRSSMTDEDQIIFNLFDRLPRRLPTWKILKLYLCSQRWVDLSGMCVLMFSYGSRSILT